MGAVVHYFLGTVVVFGGGYGAVCDVITGPLLGNGHG